MPTHHFKTSLGDQAATVSVERVNAGSDRFRVRCGRLDSEVVSTFSKDGVGRLLLAGRVLEFRAADTPTGIEIWHDGRRYCLESADRRARRAGAESAHAVTRQLLAPMPGTVLRIQVPAGQAYEAHQPLIILESMKMEMTLSTPHAGRVKAVHCGVGQLVAMGAVLADLEPGATA